MDLEERNKCVVYYYKLGMSQQEIVLSLSSNHGILLSQRHLRRILKDLDLNKRSNYSDIGDVTLFIHDTLLSGQKHGFRWMYHKCESHGLKVRKEDVRLILACLDPVGSSLRKSRRLHRRMYYSDGPNNIWHFDGYDKLKPFGFCISGCVDGFSRKIIWLNVYFTNNDPRIIGGYYIEAIEDLNGCPTKIRGDCGTENVKVKQFQTYLLRNGQTKAYLEGTSTANQRIECFWGHLRKQCLDKWLITLHAIQEDGYYTGDLLDKEIMLFCFLSQLQVCIYKLNNDN
jgi:hypothetical protein